MSYPVLYDSTETKFDSNGIGVLSDAISCVVTEERNGPFELQMQYPVDGIHYAEIRDRSLIMAKPNPVDDAQPFRVYSSTAPMDGIVTFYARHISYDLLGIPVSPFVASGIQETMQKLKSNAAKECPFTFYTDKDTIANMSVNVPSPIRNLLGGKAGSVLDTYGGGEYKFDRFDVWLYQNRGTDRGVNIRYGKNLIDLKQEKNCANVYTGVYPYWTNTDGDLVELPEKVVNGPGEYDYDHVMVYDFSQEWQESPSDEQLRSRTETYIKENNIGVPSVSLTVSHAMLENTEEYKGQALLERIDLCDTAKIEFPKLGVSASAEAVKTEFNVLLNRYDSITFGGAKTDLTDTIVSQKAEVKQTEENTKSVVGRAIDKFNRDIANASGMYTTEELQPNGSTITYLHDKKMFAESTNIIKITSDSVGVSTDGGKTYPFGLYINGDLVSRILTAIGVNAEWINAGVIDLAKLMLKGDLGGLIEGAGATDSGATRGMVMFGPAGLDDKGLAKPVYMIMSAGGWRVQLDDLVSMYMSGFVGGRGLGVVGDERVHELEDGSRGNFIVDNRITTGEDVWMGQDLTKDDISLHVYLTSSTAASLLGYNRSKNAVWVGVDGRPLVFHGNLDFSSVGSITGLPNGADVTELFSGSLTSGSHNISGSGYKWYLVIASPGSSSSRVSVLIPSEQLGQRFQVADNDYYTSFTLSSSQISFNGSNGSGIIRAIYGVK